MTNRRAFLAGAVTILAAPRTDAQQAGRVYKIGVLAIEDSPAWNAFRQGLRQLGYVEGSNTAIDWRWTQGRLEDFPGLAAELVSRNVDLIVASTCPATVTAKNATATIPIIMVVVPDPVGVGLVASLGRPGAKITGSTLFTGMQIVGKHLELLKETVPHLTRRPSSGIPSIQCTDSDCKKWSH